MAGLQRNKYLVVRQQRPWEFTVEWDVMKARGVSGGVADEVTWRRVS